MTFAVVAFALFVGMDTTIKWSTAAYPLAEIVFFNSLFSLLVVAAAAWIGGHLRALATSNPGWLLFRGLLGNLGGFSAFWGYSRLPLADAYVIAFSAPLLIAALGSVLLGETVGFRRWAVILAGFSGVVVAMRPGAGMIDPGAFGALGGATFYALSVLIVRRLRTTDSGLTFAFYTSLVGVLISLPLVLFDFIPPSPGDFAILAAGGSIGGVALVLLLTAYNRAPAAVIAPFQYTQLVWGALAGALVWDQRPDTAVIAGGAIVTASGLYLLLREPRSPVAIPAPAGAGSRAPERPS